jgi:hypothetical protein
MCIKKVWPSVEYLLILWHSWGLKLASSELHVALTRRTKWRNLITAQKSNSLFRNPGSLDIKELSLFELSHFSSLLDACRRTYFVSLCYNRVVVGHSDLAVCHVFNNDIWTGHSEELPPGSAVSAHCETPAPSVTLTDMRFTNRGTALSI